MKYCFDIDEKSLFIGVENDCGKGHSPTVHTPLNQSKLKEKWRNDIYKFLNKFNKKNVESLPNALRDKCLRQTTSDAESKIVYFNTFSKFSLDGVPFDVDASFAMFVKEEISSTITKRDHSIAKNTHLGRQKLHYPRTFTYKDDSFNIDNELVLNQILTINGGFAYIVNGFDIDSKTETLNFRTTMVGLEGVLLSNVFKIQKGVGKKLLVDKISYDNSELVSLAKDTLTDDENQLFIEKLNKIQKTSRENGKAGELYVLKNLDTIIGKKIKSPLHVSKYYPESPYDIECLVNGKKLYIEVKSTQQDKKMFYMSRGEIKFMEQYRKSYLLVLVTNVNSNDRIMPSKFKWNDIMNSKKIIQEHQSIKFIVK